MKNIGFTVFLLIASSLTAYSQTNVQSELPTTLTTSREMSNIEDEIHWSIDSSGDISRVDPSGGQEIVLIGNESAEENTNTSTTDDALTSSEGEYPTTMDFTIYPNPSTDISSIDYSIPTRKHISIKVYNALGAEIATIQDGVQYQGQHSMKIESATMDVGMYVVRFAADTDVTYKKFVVAR
ncbi:MAG: T9SS type A sorting domain-containing protein [Ignavibacteria bacterium]|nr:T9SS type A sorting domain-containing protein [Ignavibacteria bacterium]